MELRHVRYFLAVAETRSFTRAAERLHVTQPTLSHQIKQLEHLIGTVLFERAAKEVELTPAGRLFKPYCERIVREIDSGVLAISELERLIRGTLRVAVFHSFSHSVLPPILARFALLYPGVRVTTEVLPQVDVERNLLSAVLDFAVSYVEDDYDQIVAEDLFDEELVLILGSKHAFAERKAMPMRQLAKLPLVLLTPEFGARQFVDRYFADNGLKPHVALDMNAIEPILATVRHSSLATVLSAGAVVDPSGLRVVRLTDPVPKRRVAILWRRTGHRSAAALRMADMIRAAYGEGQPAQPKRVAGARRPMIRRPTAS
ncbi:MAG TPA: transcriptional regulator CynR [Pseudolabrys sp.]|nr:transcriptional regulator CynR [Pseudolabrys sp.]